MPNWVRTRLTFNGDRSRIDELKTFVKSETKDESGKLYTNLFDFNKVVPMPEELNISSSSSGEWGMRYILLNAKHSILWNDDDRSFMERMEKQKEKNPDRFNEDIELGKKYMSNILKYGYKDWYDFCSSSDGWNTKWNACEVEWTDENQVEFETAWSFCFNVVIQLSKKFPDVAIEFSYADEGSGSNTGTGTIKDGEEIDCEYPEAGDNRAYEIYLSLHPECEDELVYDPDLDTYKWIDQYEYDGE
jgi:hypothetical protein